MQQRRLRLGDIVDDYCPRERRITNHAIVAMIEDQVKQTRCSTCDAEHEYKQARIPAQRRKKDTAAGLPPDGPAASPRKRPAADAADAVPEAAASQAPEPPESHESPADETVPSQTAPADADAPLQASESPADDAAAVQASAADPYPASDTADEPAPAEDDGPVHRRLIRATLPRPEGQPPERKVPEFTMHQREANGNRAGRHRRGPRSGQMRTQQYGNGQPSRFGGPRPGPRQGPGGQGGGQGQGPPRRRKRRR